MNDLRIGRGIGTGSFGGSSNSPGTGYCVQFHDPRTNEIVDQLFASETVDSNVTTTGINHGILNDLAAQNNFSSNSQTISEFPYLADFNFYYEPSN